MKKSRCTEDQIIRVLKEVESGQSIHEVCRKHGITGECLRVEVDRSITGFRVAEVLDRSMEEFA